jgi:hypothetical protein
MTFYYARPLVQRMFHHTATDWPGWWAWQEAEGTPCPPPTVMEFRARFPEFEKYSDEIIAASIDDAACFADTTWTSNCNDCTKAIMWLAAHFLALQAMAGAALPKPVGAPGGGTYLEGGQVTSIAFETLRVSFAAPQFVAASGSGGLGRGQYDLDTTPYGRRYMDLLVLNHPGVAVV